jgi:hypothetical protein
MPSTPPSGRVLVFADEFEGPTLDTDVWVPHYLPAWSSRAASAAAYGLVDSCLRLRIPAGHPVWCAGDHQPPIRVSGIQSGSWSGPVGSTQGQQPFRSGQTVEEAQPTQWGWTPRGGWIGMRARAVLSPRSMVSLWMVGREEVPERSAEICVMEAFGDAVVPGESAAVGMGLHPFRDPVVREDFEAVRIAIDVTEFHTYACDWTADHVDFSVDGTLVRTVQGPPQYPLQLMLAVFDFPDRSRGGDDDLVPELVVDWVRGFGDPSGQAANSSS